MGTGRSAFCQNGKSPFWHLFCPWYGHITGNSHLKCIKNRKNNTTMNIKPLADRVLVEPKEAETKTASGLFIPDNAKEKPQEGTVLAVGPGKKDEPMEVKVGDTVLYGKYAGTEVHADGKSYIIMRQSDILATI
jgi:chaperonin GroES